MKTGICLLLVIFSINYCYSSLYNGAKPAEKVLYLEKDQEILKQIFDLCSSEKNSPISDLIIKVGTFLKETPYVGQTLEIEPEQLVINLRELDCTTFAENCLAISRTIKNGNNTFEQFCKEVQNIRYRNGNIDGYTSRIHYFSDWIFENNKKGLLKDISEEIAHAPYLKTIDFMSTHPGSYFQLKDSSLIREISEIEREISARKMFYIPKDRISEFENRFQDGDIAGITTKVKGLDIMHVVILVRKDGRVHLLHASATAMKVIVSEETLEDYLKNSKSATGIMVARPL